MIRFFSEESHWKTYNKWIRVIFFAKTKKTQKKLTFIGHAKCDINFPSLFAKGYVTVMMRVYPIRPTAKTQFLRSVHEKRTMYSPVAKHRTTYNKRVQVTTVVYFGAIIPKSLTRYDYSASAGKSELQSCPCTYVSNSQCNTYEGSLVDTNMSISRVRALLYCGVRSSHIKSPVSQTNKVCA